MSVEFDHVNKILDLHRQGKHEELKALYIKNQVENICVGLVTSGNKTTLYVKVGDKETLIY